MSRHPGVTTSLLKLTKELKDKLYKEQNQGSLACQRGSWKGTKITGFMQMKVYYNKGCATPAPLRTGKK